MFQQIKHSFKITGVKLRLCKERYHDLTVITIISDVVAREIESERDSCVYVPKNSAHLFSLGIF